MIGLRGHTLEELVPLTVLLNPFGSDALPIGSDFRTDSTSKGVGMIEWI